MLASTGRAIFWRLFWKEYRVQRAFWLCIAVLAVLLMALARLTVANPNDRVLWQFGFALVLPTLSAVAFGAMMFATEHEAGTFEFQQSLPLSSAQLLLGKCAYALSSGVVLYAVSWLAAVTLSGVPLSDALGNLPNWALAGGPLGRLTYFALTPISVLFALELFLWSMLYSLLLRRPLTAAVAGAATAAAVVTCIAWCISLQHNYRAEMPSYHAAVLPRLLVTFILAAADVWLGLRWLAERRPAPALRFRWPRLRIITSTAPPRTPSASSISRLLWEYWRQSRGLILAVGVLLIPLVLLFFWLNVRPGYLGDFELCCQVLYMLLLDAIVVFPLVGMAAFLGDQWGHSYRFLADRGVRPGHVWIARQLSIWVVAAVLAAVLAGVAAHFGMLWAERGHARLAAPFQPVAENIVLCAVSLAMLGVAVGQFLSMLFRNGFIVAFFGILLAAVLALWYGLMWLWGVSWFWSVLPIPLALMLATRLRAPHWIVERNTLRAWLPVALALFLPAAAIVTAVPLYRANQIPAVDPGFALAEYDQPPTASENALKDLYEQASHRYVTFDAFCKQTDRPSDTYVGVENMFWYRHGPLTPALIAWIDSSQAVIDKTLAASRSNERLTFTIDRTRRTFGTVEVWELARLVVFSAVRLEELGKLDSAIDRYLAAIRISVQLRHCAGANWSPADDIEKEVRSLLPYWAARSGQTPDRILAAVRKIDELTAHLPPDTASVKLNYLRVHRALAGGYDAMIITYGHGDESFGPLTYIWWHIPWERTRALRLLDLLTRHQLDELAKAQAAAIHGEVVPQPSFAPSPHPSELPFALHAAVYVPPEDFPDQYEQAERVHRYTETVAFRRGVRLSLLLEAWKLRHGSLPKALDELVGAGLDRVPIDPYTGISFRFVRDGVGIPLPRRSSYFGVIDAHVPFVWSAGMQITYSPLADRPGDLSRDRYTIKDNPWYEHSLGRIPASDYDLWQAGLPIPVP